MNLVVSDQAHRVNSKCKELETFIDDVNEKLSRTRYTIEIESLNTIKSSLSSYAKGFFSLKQYLLSVKKQIIEALKLVDESRLESLNSITIPSFFKTIFHEAEVCRRFAKDNYIKLDMDRRYKLASFSIELACDNCFDRAIEVANTIPDMHYRDWVLGHIAHSLVRVKDFDRAIRVANTISSIKGPLNAFECISEAIAKAGDFDRSIEIVSTIPVKYQYIALQNISKILADAGDFDRAIEVAGTIQDMSTQCFALEDISKALADAGDFDRAIEVAGTIPDKSRRGFALLHISKILVRDKDFERAIEVANFIPESHL